MSGTATAAARGRNYAAIGAFKAGDQGEQGTTVNPKHANPAGPVGRGVCLAFAVAIGLIVQTMAYAGECPGNPGALGNSRVVSLDPASLRLVGTAQYPQTLPLRDHEVVLSFDDGPSPVTTAKVLDALSAECVKATFFIIGEHANERPDLVRRAFSEGHAIGTHSQTHADLARLPLADAEQEIEAGIQSVQAALGPQAAPSPFFRAPYLQMTSALEQYLFKREVMVWSIDVDPEDWRPLTAAEVVDRTMRLLETKRSGIILLHDVQPHTAAAIPALLRTLKMHGYRVVRAVAPSGKPIALSNEAARRETLLK
jgi:peptidoglycan/xylan/chitin deacetylase (PgdA/CDA1 family)